MDLISTYFYTLKKIIFSQNFITPVILTLPLEQRHGSRLLLGSTAMKVLILWLPDSLQNIIFIFTIPAASNIDVKAPYIIDSIF